MNAEVAVIDVIERILSQMLEDDWSRARVVNFFADKYSGDFDSSESADPPATPAVTTTSASNPWGWGWGGGDMGAL